jgi:hypothetical protein
MLRAFRDRKIWERDRQVADLKFLAAAMGATFPDSGPEGDARSDQARRAVHSITDVAAALGTTVKTFRAPKH